MTQDEAIKKIDESNKLCCYRCSKEIPPGEEYPFPVADGPDDFRDEPICESCAIYIEGGNQ